MLQVVRNVVLVLIVTSGQPMTRVFGCELFVSPVSENRPLGNTSKAATPGGGWSMPVAGSDGKGGAVAVVRGRVGVSESCGRCGRPSRGETSQGRPRALWARVCWRVHRTGTFHGSLTR